MLDEQRLFFFCMGALSTPLDFSLLVVSLWSLALPYFVARRGHDNIKSEWEMAHLVYNIYCIMMALSNIN